jgi:hypothetical protein
MPFLKAVGRAVASVVDVVATAAAIWIRHDSWPEAAVDCREAARPR